MLQLPMLINWGGKKKAGFGYSVSGGRREVQVLNGALMTFYEREMRVYT